jgi:alpha-D-ribose 1-methylphosphonate 5-triphosphate synthase subunit PhnG
MEPSTQSARDHKEERMTRAERMSALALAESAELNDIWDGLAARPHFHWIRQPEFAAVMVRGRVCADGRAFNLGEAAVTRCALQLADTATVGVACVIGRRRRHATLAALLDAVAQTEDAIGNTARVRIDRLPAARAERKQAVRASVAATEVDFSMLLRAEAS